MELTLKKVAGLWYATDELLQDATALSAVASDGFSEALDLELEDVIINGTGAGQPLGIMKSPSLVTCAIETGQLADTVVAENIIKMWALLYSRSMPNAAWFISQSVLPQLMTMGVTVGVGGTPMWMPPSGLAGAPYGSLMGRPIYAIESCAKLGDLGDILLADLSQYIMIDKGGPQFASSIHLSSTTDQTCFRAVYRCDGQPAWNTTLTPKDGSSATSPFVTLAARA
jgi:HK97 family phage major capsid protein